MARLLLIDDDLGRVAALKRELASDQRQVITMRFDGRAMERIKGHRPDAIVMADGPAAHAGADVFDGVRQWDATLPVILVGEADVGTDATIQAIKRGAMDYMTWPVDSEMLGRQLDAAVAQSRLSADPADLPVSPDTVAVAATQMIGRSPAMQQVCKQIGRIAQEQVSVLIVGESGTGKEVVARAIHQHSARADRPFLAINCAALPEPLLESELFGHEQGAFTGAQARRIGKFQQSDGGTLLLDELGDMSPLIQAKFLRILQDGCFERVGGNETFRSDVRVIAATNSDLQAKIQTGEFRSDLFYRLNGFTVSLPPLRQRIEDLPLLVEHFISQANRQLNKEVLQVSQAAMQILRNHCWPGNVRELQSAITFAVVHAVAEIITPDCLPPSCQNVPRDPDGNSPPDQLNAIIDHVRRRLAAGDCDFYRDLIRQVDRIAVEETLCHVGGNQVQASRRLGLSRNTLRAKLDQARPTCGD